MLATPGFTMRLLLLLLLALSLPVQANPQPNIVLVLMDDMGWDDPAFMGNAWHETPAMDRLAAEGVVFTNAYAAAPNCKPARASLLTGRYPTTHGIYTALPPNSQNTHYQRLLAPATRYQLAPDTPTLASVLKAQGYRTGLIGKWDLGDGQFSPDAFGFDHAVGWFRGGFLESGFFAPFKLPGLEQAHEGQYLTTRLGDEAVRFIESSQQPFFLMLSHYAVHVPLQAPENTIAHFRAKPRLDDDYNATYAAMLSEADKSLATVMAALDQQGLRKNTIVIVTSDNGAMPELARHSALTGGKGSLSEGGIRVPLIWSGPGVISSRNTQPVSHIDLMPTLLQRVNSPSPATDGVDVSDCLINADCLIKRSLYWHFPVYITDPRFDRGFSASPTAAIRDNHWKLIEDLELDRLYLYDMRHDPAEQADLSGKYPELTMQLQKQLHDWQAETKAAMPTPNPQYDSLTGLAYWRDTLQRRWDQWRTRLLVWLMLRDTQ